MPVTAKLSKHFYEALGEDLANELVEWFNAVDTTYRSDLRELNELNYARFEAKLEQRVAELRAEIRQELNVVRTEMREGFARADGQVARLEGRFDGQIGRLEGLIKSTAQETRAELLKWMFAGWATLLGTMIALIKLG